MDHFAMPYPLPEAGSSQNQGQRREHSAQDWENQRPHITRLYSAENRSLEEVTAVMKVEYGFEANERQFKRRISQWHLDKKLKDSETRHMAQKQKKREIFENKDTNFRVRGRSVEPDKISRAVKRKNISDEELLAMPAAPTPSDISYYTPSAIDPHSPYGHHPSIESPAPNVNLAANLGYVQSNTNTLNSPSQQSFLVSPGYKPATPVPPGWDAPVTPIPSGSFQTPPGIFQSPGTLWYTGYIDGMLDRSPTTANTEIQNCETKVTRLIELVRKTEETVDTDYMGTMSEVNSLVYDLITSDHASREAISEEKASFIPKCYVCRALEEIGTDDMAKKVESERVLLEAIAVSEGRFGEKHSAPLHFKVKLFLLYDNWSCRIDSRDNLLARLLVLVLLKGPTKSESDTLSALTQSNTFSHPRHCAWFRDVTKDPALGTSLSTSSHHLMSTLSTHGDSIRESPRRLLNVVSDFAGRVGQIERDDLISVGPIFDLILNLGPESVDGSSYFWMVTFILAVSRMWESIFNSRYLISNAVVERALPGSTVLQSSIERFLDGPYRLDISAETAASAESPSENCELPLAEKHTKFDDITKLEGPLTNLEQLGMVLAEVALREIDKSCDPEALDILQHILPVSDIYDTIRGAARIGSSYLITLFGKNFKNFAFESAYPLEDILNIGDDFCEFIKFRESGFYQAPLCVAAKGGHQRCVEALINAGADANGPEHFNFGIGPIELAADAGHDDIVRLLIENGALSDNERVLMCVVNSSDKAFHERWVERTLNDDDWYSLLKVVMLSGKNEEYELYNILSERLRADFWRLENESGEPAIPALASVFKECWWALGDVLDLADDNDRGLELLLDTVTGVHVEQQARRILRSILLEFAIAESEFLQVDESSGLPILHALVCRNAPNALGVFLSLGPNINLTDVHNNTALHIAAGRNRIACADLLLQSGINAHAENVDGETALQICIRKEHAVVAEEIMRISLASTYHGGDGQAI